MYTFFIKIYKFFKKKIKNQNAGGTFTLLLINKELSEYENSSKKTGGYIMKFDELSNIVIGRAIEEHSYANYLMEEERNHRLHRLIKSV